MTQLLETIAELVNCKLKGKLRQCLLILNQSVKKLTKFNENCEIWLVFAWDYNLRRKKKKVYTSSNGIIRFERFPSGQKLGTREHEILTIRDSC